MRKSHPPQRSGLALAALSFPLALAGAARAQSGMPLLQFHDGAQYRQSGVGATLNLWDPDLGAANPAPDPGAANRHDLRAEYLALPGGASLQSLDYRYVRGPWALGLRGAFLHDGIAASDNLDANGAPAGGDLQWREDALSATVARDLPLGFRAGAGYNFYQARLDTYAAAGSSANLGLAWSGAGLAAELAAYDLGPGVKYYQDRIPQPSEIQAGMRLRLPWVGGEAFAKAAKVRGEDPAVLAGYGRKINRWFSAYACYTSANRIGLPLGAGVGLSLGPRLSLAYDYQPRGTFGAVQGFRLGYAFGAPPRPEAGARSAPPAPAAAAQGNAGDTVAAGPAAPAEPPVSARADASPPAAGAGQGSIGDTVAPKLTTAPPPPVDLRAECPEAPARRRRLCRLSWNIPEVPAEPAFNVYRRGPGGAWSRLNGRPLDEYEFAVALAGPRDAGTYCVSAVAGNRESARMACAELR